MGVIWRKIYFSVIPAPHIEIHFGDNSYYLANKIGRDLTLLLTNLTDIFRAKKKKKHHTHDI